MSTQTQGSAEDESSSGPSTPESLSGCRELPMASRTMQQFSSVALFGASGVDLWSRSAFPTTMHDFDVNAATSIWSFGRDSFFSSSHPLHLDNSSTLYSRRTTSLQSTCSSSSSSSTSPTTTSSLDTDFDLTSPFFSPQQQNHQFLPDLDLLLPDPTSPTLPTTEAQDCLLFASTESIREDLRLVANYVSTLEERVSQNVRCAGLRQKAEMEVRKFCRGHDDEKWWDDDWRESGSVAPQTLAARFDASELKKRLGGIRRDIEGIVGFT
ncbi:hypothetical protein Slin14017_G034660 [Septoria linicola]|nr:hypothetical protein Slin14017_G034660 [Septoria linicola]